MARIQGADPSVGRAAAEKLLRKWQLGGVPASGAPAPSEGQRGVQLAAWSDDDRLLSDDGYVAARHAISTRWSTRPPARYLAMLLHGNGKPQKQSGTGGPTPVASGQINIRCTRGKPSSHGLSEIRDSVFAQGRSGVDGFRGRAGSGGGGGGRPQVWGGAPPGRCGPRAVRGAQGCYGCYRCGSRCRWDTAAGAAGSAAEALSGSG